MSQGYTKGTPIDTDGTMSLNSDIVVPSQKAVRTYISLLNINDLNDVVITSPLNGNGIEYNGTLWINVGIQYTIELVAALTVDFYAPYAMSITSVSNVLNSPTITLQDDGVSYTLGNTIAIGSKVTVTASTLSVVNLNITKI
jgi:hypothetical protein